MTRFGLGSSVDDLKPQTVSRSPSKVSLGLLGYFRPSIQSDASPRTYFGRAAENLISILIAKPTTMISRSNPGFTLTIFAGLASLAFYGCSDDGLEKRYPVTGTVTYQGKPLSKGSISFLPDDPSGRGAVGEIIDGSYSLTTQDPGDGAFPGSYSVTITSLEVDTSAAEEESKKKAAKAKVDASALPDQAAVAKAYKNAKSNIPAKYGQIASSGLKFEVKPETNKYDIELKD